MSTKTPRERVGVIWQDVLDERMDDCLPGKDIEVCIQELIVRAEAARKLSILLEILCEDIKGIDWA